MQLLVLPQAYMFSQLSTSKGTKSYDCQVIMFQNCTNLTWFFWFKLEFEDELWLEYFKLHLVCIYETYKSSNWSLTCFAIWLLQLVKFSRFKYFFEQLDEPLSPTILTLWYRDTTIELLFKSRPQTGLYEKVRCESYSNLISIFLVTF